MPDAFDMEFPAEGLPNVLDRAGVGGYTDYDAAIGNQVSSGVTISTIITRKETPLYVTEDLLNERKAWYRS